CKQKKHSSTFVEWLTWIYRVSHKHSAENIKPPRIESFFRRLQCSTARAYSDSGLGVRFVIEGIESTRSVFKAITATRNAARPIQFSQRKAHPEIAMGEIGLKARLSGRNPVARRYWPERTARHITSKPEAQTTISRVMA